MNYIVLELWSYFEKKIFHLHILSSAGVKLKFMSEQTYITVSVS